MPRVFFSQIHLTPRGTHRAEHQEVCFKSSSSAVSAAAGSWASACQCSELEDYCFYAGQGWTVISTGYQLFPLWQSTFFIIPCYLQIEDVFVLEFASLVLSELTREPIGCEQLVSANILSSLFSRMKNSLDPDVQKNCLQVKAVLIFPSLNIKLAILSVIHSQWNKTGNSQLLFSLWFCLVFVLD